jgi:hypothetical protein
MSNLLVKLVAHYLTDGGGGMVIVIAKKKTDGSGHGIA